MLKFYPLQPLEACFGDASTQGSAWSLKGTAKPGELGCYLQDSSCGLQADRLRLLPGHCGHLSRTGQMPNSKIFAPQNTEAEIYDSLPLPSFYTADKKICWLPCGIICRGNAICLHFINPVIMLAMKLPTWLLHVFSKYVSQHFTRSLSNTAIVLYIDKVRQNSLKRGLKSTLEHPRQLLCSRTVFGTFCCLGLTVSVFSSAPQLILLLRRGERPTWYAEHDFSTCPPLLLLTCITHKVCLASKETVLSTSSFRDVEIHSPEQGARGTERLPGCRRWQGTGTWNIFWSSGSKGDGSFCLPQSSTNPDPGTSFDVVQWAVRL